MPTIISGNQTISNASLAMNDNTTASVTGNNDTITIGNNDNLTVAGSGNTVNAIGTSSTSHLYMSSNTINVGNGAYLTVIGSNNSVNANGTSTTSHIYLSSNTVYVVNNGKTAIGGNSNTINLGNSGYVGVTGNSNTLTLGSRNALTVTGGGNTINATSGSVLVDPTHLGQFYSSNGQPVVDYNGQTYSLYQLYADDSGQPYFASANNAITVSSTNGNADIINSSGNAGLGVYAYNLLPLATIATTPNQKAANNSNAGIFLSANTQAIVNGSGNSISLSGGDTVTVNGGFNVVKNVGTNDRVTVNNYVTNQDFFIIANNDLSTGTTADGQTAGIFIQANSMATLIGNNNSITLADYATVTLSGTGNNVTGGDHDTINIVTPPSTPITTNINISNAAAINIQGINAGAAQTVHITGSGNLIHHDYNPNNIVTITGDNNTSTGSSSGSTLTFIGNNNVLNSGFSTVNIGDASHNGNSLTIGGNIEGNINDYGSHDTITIDSSRYISSSYTAFGSYETFIDSSAGYGQYTFANNSIGNTLQVTHSTINMGSGNTDEHIIGSENTIYVSGSGDDFTSTQNSIYLTSAASLTVTGDSNIFSGVANSQVTDILSDNSSVSCSWGTDATQTITVNNANISFNGGDTSIVGSANSIYFGTVHSGPNNNFIVNGDNNTFTSLVGNTQITNNRSDGTSIVYKWDENRIQSCDSWSGLNGTGTLLGSSADPLILSLNGSKVQTTSLADSQAYFDVQNNGQAVHTAWAAAGEGILVYNPANPDGPVTQDSQLVGSFAALKRLDSNNDATLSNQDAAWQDLRVWVSSGTATGGSLDTLDQLGISAINLNATATNISSNGNTILADSSFTWADGSTGDIAGVALAYDRSSVDQLVSALASFAPAPAATSAFAANDTLTQPQLLAAAH